MDRRQRQEALVAGVQKPARYLGGEAGALKPSADPQALKFALCFPEPYELAMSHLGLKILYEQLGAMAGVSVERVFSPWKDLMDLLEAQGEAPWSLEGGRPLGEFDVIGFSLPYELTYTNLLHMLRLAGVPLLRQGRSPGQPVVVGGGCAMVNPEPLADFLDLAVVGEAEELLPQLISLLRQARDEGWERDRLYRQAQAIEGVYAPALFRPVYDDTGRLLRTEPLDPAHPKVRRRIVADLDAHQPPLNQPSPAVTPVHDRLGLEVARGCTRGCRFCQAGYIYRPVRERHPQKVMDYALEGLARTGFEELALLSLSTGDYCQAQPLIAALMDRLEPHRTSLSLPSLRVDSLSQEIIEQIKRVRKTGFTLAPEAGSQRLRDVINKALSDEQIVGTAGRVFGLGWKLIKLYFMIGLPTETDADLEALGQLCARVADQGPRGGKKPLVNASIGTFVPKPHTPFQWEAQVDLDEALRRLRLAKAGIGHRKVKAKWNEPHTSILEGVMSRGDRRLGPVLLRAVELGCRFDGWSEELDLGLWERALAEEGLGFAEYLRARERDEALPWDHIDTGVTKDFLWGERQRALAGQPTADCRSGACGTCGVCDFENFEPRLHREASLEPGVDPEFPEEREKLRFRLEKTGPARFLGHLEMISQIVRALRRAGLMVAHSQGFHPHPLVKLDSALPLGVESVCEVLEVQLLGHHLASQVAAVVNPQLPQGLVLAEGRPARPDDRLDDPSQVTYTIEVDGQLDPEGLERFAQAETWEYRRQTPKGTRTMDLKKAVRELSLAEGRLRCTVTKDGARPKPHEVLEGIFGLDLERAQAMKATKVEARY